MRACRSTRCPSLFSLSAFQLLKALLRNPREGLDSLCPMGWCKLLASIRANLETWNLKPETWKCMERKMMNTENRVASHTNLRVSAKSADSLPNLNGWFWNLELGTWNLDFVFAFRFSVAILDLQSSILFSFPGARPKGAPKHDKSAKHDIPKECY